jgi:hypothetical protein
MTNTTTSTLKSIQAASQSTFINAQLYSTPGTSLKIKKIKTGVMLIQA